MSPPKKPKHFAAGRLRPKIPSGQTTSFDIEETLANAIKNHQAGNLQQAETTYKEILSINPTHAETLHAQAIMACQRGQHATAIPLFQKAIHETPAKTVYHYNLGNALKDLKRFDEAVACYGQALLLKPDYLDALNNLGITFHHQERFDEALSAYQKALEINPDHAAALYNMANTLQSQDRLQEALLYYQKALAAKENFPEAYNKLGNIFRGQGKPEAAIGCFQYALQIDPMSAEYHSNLALAFSEQGKLNEAIACCQKAIALAPTSAIAYNNLGDILKDQGRLAEAEVNLRRALELNPDLAEAHSNLGNVLHEQGRLTEAEASFLRALELKPDLAEVYNNLGYVLQSQNRLTEAEASLRRALALKPDLAEVYNNLGNVLQNQNRLTEAEVSLRRALELKPAYAGAHNNLGTILLNQGRLTEAEASCHRALELLPDYATAHSNLLFVLNYHPDQSSEAIFEAYREYDKRLGIPLRGEWRVHENSLETNRRLKVGYVSPDFRHHSVSHFLEPLLAHHDKGVVEVYAYAQLSREDDVTARYKGYADHWVPTMGLTDPALAERIRTDGIDILVDLAGQTAKNRLGVFARKPAPVSISWLGYGYTTGLTAIDYYLTDCATTPAGSEGLFSETPWRLTTPGYTYRPAEGMGPVSQLPAAERGYITFGTLTRAIRINHRTIRVWSEILKRVPGSRLVLDSSNYKDPTMQTALAEKFATHGINRERLEIGFHSPPWDVLRGMDIGLDCFPHNSGTTLFESLYMGVPFVTLAGRPSVGRLGTSILEGIGHPEWVAWTEDEYIEIAVALASDLPQLANLRADLRKEMEAGPLMDEPAFARKVEAAYREMFAKWCEKKQ